MKNERNVRSSRPRRRKLSKQFLTLLSVVLVLSAVVGGTVAYLTDDTDPVTNSFTEGRVSCSVGDDGVITNTGNVKANIRAAVVVNWAKIDDPDTIYWKAPDATVSAGNDWTKTGDFYYCYNVAVGADTSALTASTTDEAPAGYELQVAIVAEAIQADGRTGTWGEAPTN